MIVSDREESHISSFFFVIILTLSSYIALLTALHLFAKELQTICTVLYCCCWFLFKFISQGTLYYVILLKSLH